MSPELIDLERRIKTAQKRHGITDAEIMEAIKVQRRARALENALIGIIQFERSMTELVETLERSSQKLASAFIVPAHLIRGKAQAQ